MAGQSCSSQIGLHKHVPLHKSIVIAQHNAGKSNVVADQQSRVFGNNSNWRLEPQMFVAQKGLFPLIQVDRFADCLDHQRVLELAARSSCRGSGYCDESLEFHEGICVSSCQIDSSYSEEGSRRAVRDAVSSSSVVPAALVSTPTQISLFFCQCLTTC